MRIYSSFKEAIKETERELVEMGTLVNCSTMQDKEVEGDPRFMTKELQGYSFKITDHARKDEEFEELGGNLSYARQELFDRINSAYLNPGKSYLERLEVWKEFLHNGKFGYTYNERFREQLPIIIQELKDRPNTRQAIITMYDRHQDIQHLGGASRVPCSMYYQFLRRTRNKREELDLMYTMRSCDFYTHFIYDIWLSMELQFHLAGALGIQPGHFTYFAGSFHAYAKDYETKGVF